MPGVPGAALPHPRRTTDPASYLHAEAPGPLLAEGTAADVYAVDDETVLRRYRTSRESCSEVAVVGHVVDHGFPAPRVLAHGGADIVMERLHGPTLLQSLAAGETTIPDAGRILASLHERLHAIPAPPGAIDDGSAAAGPVVVHLDLHPGNVILTERYGPALVDWSNAGAGSAAVDVALTALILAEVAVDAGGVYSQAARALLASFLTATAVPVLDALDEATRFRTGDPALVVGERELVPAAAQLVRELVAVAGRD
ncbi:phosphotransferase [Cellulomonas sp. HZM]|uniref:phosphotransferase n=1 Tax=Cellulomonas sp. HZM TaxID=1454010 RepID=UPI001E41CF40|nr:phosphotransferase [Cellulomonas sp. HZM]